VYDFGRYLFFRECHPACHVTADFRSPDVVWWCVTYGINSPGMSMARAAPYFETEI
jgi:hypothetical protein